MDRPNSPLGGLRRVAERQRADRDRQRRVGRVADAFRRHDDAAETERRSRLRALAARNAPFPRRRRK
jgi:hypothetical protein